MTWWCCLRKEKAYKKIDQLEQDAEIEPAKYVSASLDSEYDLENFGLKRTLTSMYQKMSEWSLPSSNKKMNLFTLNEEEHEFLIDSPIPSEHPPEQQQPENFDDVVDEMV